MHRRTTTAALALVLSTASMSAQNPQQNPRDARTGADHASHAVAPVPLDSRAFVEQLGMAGLTEVRLGTIATERGVSEDVKKFGQMMVRDHTEGLKNLAQAASRMNLKVPTALDATHQQTIDRLAALPGQSFDLEYMTAMVKAHEEVLAKVRARVGTQQTSAAPAGPARAETGVDASPVAGNAGAEVRDQRVGTSGAGGEDALAQWSAKALPTVQHHFDEARRIQRTVK